jgi:hypothetical protein
VTLKIARSRGIFIGSLTMLASIDFNDEVQASRNEVADERANRNLTVEANPRDLPRA